MSKAPFDKKFVKGPKSEGNKPKRAMKNGKFENSAADVDPKGAKEGSKADTALDKKQRKPRMSSFKAGVIRALGQK